MNIMKCAKFRNNLNFFFRYKALKRMTMNLNAKKKGVLLFGLVVTGILIIGITLLIHFSTKMNSEEIGKNMFLG